MFTKKLTALLAIVATLFAATSCLAAELKKVATFEIPGGAKETTAPTVSYSPDGKLLVCAGLDNRLYVFDAKTNKPIGKIEVPGNTGEKAVRITRFSPDGKLLAAFSADKKVYLFDTTTLKSVRSSEPLAFDGGPLKFSHDGSKLIAIGSYERTFFVIDVATCKTLLTQKYKSEDWLTVTPSPVADEAAVVVVDPQLTVKIVSLTTGETLRENKVGGISARGLKYAPDGKTLAAAAEEILYLINSADLKVIKEVDEFLTNYVFAPDNTKIVYFSRGLVQPIDFRTWKPSPTAKFETSIEGSYAGFALSPDGNLAAIAFVDYRQLPETSNLVLVDIKGKQQVGDLHKLGVGHVFDYDFSPDGSRLATTSQNKAEVTVWDISAWSKPAKATADAGAFRTWVSADGKFQVEAELVEATDTVVKLKRKDTGAVISVPLTGLSDADRAFLKSQTP